MFYKHLIKFTSIEPFFPHFQKKNSQTGRSFAHNLVMIYQQDLLCFLSFRLLLEHGGRKLLDLKTKSGETAVDMATSPEMLQLLQQNTFRYRKGLSLVTFLRLKSLKKKVISSADSSFRLALLGSYLLVSAIASIFMVDYSSIFPTDDRPIIDFSNQL